MRSNMFLASASGILILLASGSVMAGGSRLASGTKATVSCSAADGGQPATCVRIPCGALESSFAGTWSGHFVAYVRSKSTPAKPVYRPYDESVTYGHDACLKDPATGDTFIVGHQVDHYSAFAGLPAMTDKSLLIMGKRADGKRFMRTVDRQHGSHDYTLVFADKAAQLAVWRLHMPAAKGRPDMTFTVIDAKDFAALPARQRDVTVTMQVGPSAKPYWQGVLARGSHRLQ